jgi:hypothetical protein
MELGPSSTYVVRIGWDVEFLNSWRWSATGSSAPSRPSGTSSSTSFGLRFDASTTACSSTSCKCILLRNGYIETKYNVVNLHCTTWRCQTSLNSGPSRSSGGTSRTLPLNTMAPQATGNDRFHYMYLPSGTCMNPTFLMGYFRGLLLYNILK